MLRELKACHVHGLKQLVLHLPASHPLASLDLSNCHYLQVLDLHLAGLTTLNLSACRTLYRLRMRCAGCLSRAFKCALPAQHGGCVHSHSHS